MKNQNKCSFLVFEIHQGPEPYYFEGLQPGPPKMGRLRNTAYFEKCWEPGNILPAAVARFLMKEPNEEKEWQKLPQKSLKMPVFGIFSPYDPKNF